MVAGTNGQWSAPPQTPRNTTSYSALQRRSQYSKLLTTRPTMTYQEQLEVIEKNPIGGGLNSVRDTFKSLCHDKKISCSLDALDELDQDGLKDLALDLLGTLQVFRAPRLLRSSGSGNYLSQDIASLFFTAGSPEPNLDHIKPLLKVALVDNPNDALIWGEARNAVIKSAPPPRPIISSAQQTPLGQSMGSFVNSSEHRQNVNRVLNGELGTIYIDHPKFFDRFFGEVTDLVSASKAVLAKCREGDDPLFTVEKGWSGWPQDANEHDVLPWLVKLNKELVAFAEDYKPTPTSPRSLLVQPSKSIAGSTARRKMNIGFVNTLGAGEASEYDWSKILVPGELKRNPNVERSRATWLDLARYAREVFALQDRRRFVLGFTLCGSLMRIWEFDRLGAIASKRFDIHKEGLRFVSVILGFHWMKDEELGFDSTITTRDSTITTDGSTTNKHGKQWFVMINREGQEERLIIDGLMGRTGCIAGRATTCWKAHREGVPYEPLVIKDSWQHTEREDEGNLLEEATRKNVTNVARHYYHEAVIVGSETDDIRGNVRKGMEMWEARKYPLVLSPNTNAVDGLRKGSSSSATGSKRSFSHNDVTSSRSKRSRSASSTKSGSKRSRLASSTKSGSNEPPNRVHRRVILRDYGKAIYKASSRSALLAALEGCIEGHKSLRKAGLLHRDISINNLIINEDGEKPTSFLIDLDLAIREDRKAASGAKGRTGTKAFMAIGVLQGEQHSFMHDLESFFWVLFWICIHYNGPNQQARVVESFEDWNYMDMNQLAMLKHGMVFNENSFLNSMEEFTEYYKPLAPWVSALRDVVFLDRQPGETENEGLYSQMKGILGNAREAMEVLEADSNT